jgi:hypothetical protein
MPWHAMQPASRPPLPPAAAQLLHMQLALDQQAGVQSSAPKYYITTPCPTPQTTKHNNIQHLQQQQQHLLLLN